jgi:hypothetical protein
MSIKRKLRSLLLCSTLALGSLMGVPMRAEEIEALLRAMNQPKIARTIPDESDDGDLERGRRSSDPV